MMNNAKVLLKTGGRYFGRGVFCFLRIMKSSSSSGVGRCGGQSQVLAISIFIHGLALGCTLYTRDS